MSNLASPGRSGPTAQLSPGQTPRRQGLSYIVALPAATRLFRGHSEYAPTWYVNGLASRGGASLSLQRNYVRNIPPR